MIGSSIDNVRRSIITKALITGITGQDGSYLADLLIDKGYTVHGLVRRASTSNTERIEHLMDRDDRLTLHYGDLSNQEQITNLVYNLRPDEIYHLGAQSHVHISFDAPEYTGDITGLGTTRILEAVRRSGIKTRCYQASSSEMYGGGQSPQRETTQISPRSPYAVAKVYAYWMAVNYRIGHGMFVCNGILFNHESPRRGVNFVSRKITRAVALIRHGLQDRLYLGNLDARRDWGYAPEYVDAMWRMLQHDCPDDYVIGTGETHSVRDFVDEAFAHVGLDWRDHVTIDPRLIRPLEVDYLQADAEKARRVLNWEPSVRFHELVRIMVDADMKIVRAD